MTYEKVYTVDDYYDGPKVGVADYEGRPHFYEREFDEGVDEYADSYFLTPIDDETLELELEHWAIWLRWLAANRRGETSIETHPALPKDRPRWEQIVSVLRPRLVTDPERAVRKLGDFKAVDDQDDRTACSGLELVVRWYDP